MNLKKLEYILTFEADELIDNLQDIYMKIEEYNINKEISLEIGEDFISVKLADEEQFMIIYGKEILVQASDSKKILKYQELTDIIFDYIRGKSENTIKNMEIEASGTIYCDGEDIIQYFKNKTPLIADDLKIEYKGYSLYAIYKNKPYVIELHPLFKEHDSFNFNATTKFFFDDTDVKLDEFYEITKYVEGKLINDLYDYLLENSKRGD